MPTNTAGTVARETPEQQVHYLRKAIDEVSGTTISVGWLPAGAIVLPSISGVNINTVFSGTNPELDIGVLGDLERFAGDLDLDAAASFVAIDDVTDLKVTADVEVLATIDLSTPVAADGSADIIIAYVVDNDQ